MKNNEVQKLRQLAFRSAMNATDGQTTANEIIDRAKQLPTLEAAYYLLNCASFLPDSWEISIRRALAEEIRKPKP
jgi:hypothetical protein